MIKHINYLFCCSMVLLLAACTTTNTDEAAALKAQENENKVIQYGKDRNVTLTKDASGMYYTVNNISTTARSPKEKELIKVHFTYTFLDGTHIDSTNSVQNIPQAFIYNVYSTLLNYPAALLREGGSGTFIFPQTSQFDEPTILKVKMVSTRDESEQVSDYVKEKFAGLQTTTTASGLQYIITRSVATGDVMKNGQTVTVNYTGKLLYQTRQRDANGFYTYTDVFDSGSLSFILGQANSVISGFAEGVSKLKVGDKGTFVFPSSLGYEKVGVTNSSGVYLIQPYSPLTFDIEVTAVK